MTCNDHPDHDGDNGRWLGVLIKVRVCEVRFTARYELWFLVKYWPTALCRHMTYSGIVVNSDAQ